MIINDLQWLWLGKRYTGWWSIWINLVHVNVSGTLNAKTSSFHNKYIEKRALQILEQHSWDVLDDDRCMNLGQCKQQGGCELRPAW